MRRTLAVLALSGLVAVVAGSAAGLDVNAGALQYGEASATCDTNGVNVHWGLESNDGRVYGVRISDVDEAACAGASMFVNVFDEAGNSLFESPEGPATNRSISIPGTISAADVAKVHVSIEG